MVVRCTPGCHCGHVVHPWLLWWPCPSGHSHGPHSSLWSCGAPVVVVAVGALWSSLWPCGALLSHCALPLVVVGVPPVILARSLPHLSSWLCGAPLGHRHGCVVPRSAVGAPQLSWWLCHGHVEPLARLVVMGGPPVILSVWHPLLLVMSVMVMVVVAMVVMVKKCMSCQKKGYRLYWDTT